ncbi:MAG TPA: N-acetylmuramoyl-L-alanine amidase [Pantanalinema sp.]
MRNITRWLVLVAAAAIAAGPLAPVEARVRPRAEAARVARPVADPAVVTGIYWRDGRLEIEGDRPLQARLLKLEAPHRVVIDLFGAELADPALCQTLSIQEGPFAQLRVALHPEEGFIRFVLDCTAEADVRLSQQQEGQTLSLARVSPDPARAPRPEQGSRVTRTPIEAHGPAAPRVFLEHGPAVPDSFWVYGPALPADWPEALSERQLYGPAQPAPSPSPTPEALVSLETVARAQRLDSLTLRRKRGQVFLRLACDRALSYEVEQEWAPSKLTVRVPGGSFAGRLPGLVDGVEALGVEKEGKDWLLHLTLPRGLYAYDAQAKDGGKVLELSWRRQDVAGGKPTVIVDAGHGGDDPGAIGPGGTKEAHVTLAMARAVREALEARGDLNVVMTRTTDSSVDLASRARLVDTLKPALFVSLHGNSCESAEIGGLETYYRNEVSRPLARHLHSAIARILGRPDRGVRQARLYVLRSQSVPSVLVESAYLSNPDEEKLLASESFQKELGSAVAKGILGYLSQTPVAELPSRAE